MHVNEDVWWGVLGLLGKPVVPRRLSMLLRLLQLLLAFLAPRLWAMLLPRLLAMLLWLLRLLLALLAPPPVGHAAAAAAGVESPKSANRTAMVPWSVTGARQALPLPAAA